MISLLDIVKQSQKVAEVVELRDDIPIFIEDLAQMTRNYNKVLTKANTMIMNQYPLDISMYKIYISVVPLRIYWIVLRVVWIKV